MLFCVLVPLFLRFDRALSIMNKNAPLFVPRRTLEDERKTDSFQLISHNQTNRTILIFFPLRAAPCSIRLVRPAKPAERQVNHDHLVQRLVLTNWFGAYQKVLRADIRVQ